MYVDVACCMCAFRKKKTHAALGVADQAGCWIIFRRAAPSLRRASLKSAGSLCLPSQAPGVQPSPAENSTRPATHSTALHTDGQTAYAVQHDIFTGVQQVDRSSPVFIHWFIQPFFQLCAGYCAVANIHNDSGNAIDPRDSLFFWCLALVKKAVNCHKLHS